MSDSEYQIALQPTRPTYYYLTASGRVQKSYYDEVHRLRNKLLSLLRRRHRVSVARYWPHLFSAVSRILYRNDPGYVRIPFFVAEKIGMPRRCDQRDEYEGEAASIVACLPCCAGSDDVERVVRETLTRSFGGAQHLIAKRLQKVGTQIWSVWRSRTWPGLR